MRRKSVGRTNAARQRRGWVMLGNKLLTTAFAASAIALAGCSHSTAGAPVTSTAKAGNLPSVMTTTTEKPATTTSAAPAGNSMDAEVTKYAQAVNDWWAQNGASVGEVEVKPVSENITCAGDSVPDDALFCHHKSGGGTLKYKPAKFTAMQKDGGELTVELVVAHELGHAVQYAKDTKYSTDELAELSADCFAGAYIKSSTSVTPHEMVTAMKSTQLMDNYPVEAADAAMAGGLKVSDQVLGQPLVDFCLTYKP